MRHDQARGPGSGCSKHCHTTGLVVAGHATDNTVAGHEHNPDWGRGSTRAQSNERQQQHSLHGIESVFRLEDREHGTRDHEPLACPGNIISGFLGLGSGERTRTESSA